MTYIIFSNILVKSQGMKQFTKKSEKKSHIYPSLIT